MERSIALSGSSTSVSLNSVPERGKTGWASWEYSGPSPALGAWGAVEASTGSVFTLALFGTSSGSKPCYFEVF